MNHFLKENIHNWAAEFAESETVREFPSSLQEYAVHIAGEFLLVACGDKDPHDLIEGDLKRGLFDGVGRQALSQTELRYVPQMCAVFFEMLQGQGRVNPGRALPSYIKALSAAYVERAGVAATRTADKDFAATKSKPVIRPGTKLSPNSPCPCGSGKKYKKCCMNLLR